MSSWALPVAAAAQLSPVHYCSVPLPCLGVPARFLSAIKCSITLSNRVAHVSCYSCCCTSGHCSTCQSQHHSRTAAGDESWCEAPFSPCHSFSNNNHNPRDTSRREDDDIHMELDLLCPFDYDVGKSISRSICTWSALSCCSSATTSGRWWCSSRRRLYFLAYHLNWCSLHIHRFHPQSAITFHFIYSSSSSSS